MAPGAAAPFLGAAPTLPGPAAPFLGPAPGFLGPDSGFLGPAPPFRPPAAPFRAPVPLSLSHFFTVFFPNHMLTAKQDNRLSAAENLAAALKADPAPYAADKALKTVAQRLDEIIADMQPLRTAAQRTANAGAPAGGQSGKEAARETLAIVTAEIAGDVFAYASEKKLPALQALADYNENGLHKLRGSRLSDVATALLAELPNHQAVLADEYGLDKDRIKELQDAIKEFNGLKTAPRQAQVDGKTTRTSLRAEFAELGTLLKDRFQRLMRKYKRRDVTFYNRLMDARAVVDRAGSGPGGDVAPAKA